MWTHQFKFSCKVFKNDGDIFRRKKTVIHWNKCSERKKLVEEVNANGLETLTTQRK